MGIVLRMTIPISRDVANFLFYVYLEELDICELMRFLMFIVYIIIEIGKNQFNYQYEKNMQIPIN